MQKRISLLISLVFVFVLGTAGMVLSSPAQSSGKNDAVQSTQPVKININTATIQNLTRLPGIGPKTAQRIVTYRKENGPFKKIEEIMNVRGIGRKKFERIKSMITVH